MSLYLCDRVKFKPISARENSRVQFFFPATQARNKQPSLSPCGDVKHCITLAWAGVKEKSFLHVSSLNIIILNYQAPVVQKLDKAIHWINLYSLDNTIIGFCKTYLLDSAIQRLNNSGQTFHTTPWKSLGQILQQGSTPM